MKRWLVGLLALSLIWPWPAIALDLQGLYEQALNASRSGDFVQALPLWDRVLEQSPQDAAALSNRGNVRLALGDLDDLFNFLLCPHTTRWVVRITENHRFYFVFDYLLFHTIEINAVTLLIINQWAAHHLTISLVHQVRKLVIRWRMD